MILIRGGDTLSKAAEAISIGRCQCGKVELAATGAPILFTICHCSSCKEAGHLLQALPGAAAVLDASDGTPVTLFRKDRVRPVRGADLLAEHRLKPDSPTRRVVATCCNTTMFLDFTKGHWLSVYSGRIVVAEAASVAPPRVDGRFGFFGRLIIAWAAMGFRTPKIDYVGTKLDLGRTQAAL
jgi:hypothetical protein